MKKNITVILAVLAIGYTGCKDNAYAPPAPATSNSYLPQTFGSTWKYRDSIYGEKINTASIYGVKIDTLTVTINGGVTDFNSTICYNAEISSIQYGSGAAYFYAEKHLFGSHEQSALFGLADFEFLVDTASVGYTWINAPTQNTLLNGSPLQSINTVREKGITKIVGGKTFTNVIHTSANFQINIKGTGFHNIAYYDFFLAKGIGIIEKDSYVYGNLDETKTIIDYNIK